jgi:hypothetical protein
MLITRLKNLGKQGRKARIQEPEARIQHLNLKIPV